MDEKQAVIILVLIKVIILGLIVIGACLYAIPLCFIRQFHTPLNLLTLNVCVAAFVCSSFWGIFFIMNTFYVDILWTVESCIPILYVQIMVVCQVLYAICMVLFNRLLTIVYNRKALFHTKKWVAVCVAIQWIFAGLITLPAFASSLSHCFISGLEFNYQLYALIIIGVIPAICLIVTNFIIFNFTRRSTRRVQAIHDNNERASNLSNRDARILKHMIFIFVVYFCGWVPLYIIAVINWDGTAVPYVVLHGVMVLPAVSLFIDIVDLFLYNYELRRYFMNNRQIQPPRTGRT